MSALISLDELRFRGAFDFSDEQLAGIANDATDIVIDYLKTPDHEWTVETVPGPVRSAIIRVAILLRDQSVSDKPVNFIDEGVKDLLHRFRDPAMQ